MTRRTVPQPIRYTFLIIELGALLGANRFAFGTWLPSAEPSGLWFYAALFGLLLGQRLDTPFFTTPKDAVLYAVPALVATLQLSDEVWSNNGNWGNTAHILLIIWIVLVLIVSSLAVWLQAARTDSVIRLGLSATQLSGSLGNPRTFFSVILVLVLLAFPPQTVERLLILAVAWAVAVPFSILDHAYELVRRIRRSITKGFDGEPAEVVSFQYPHLLIVREQRQDAIPIGSVVAYRDIASDVRLAFILSHAGRDTGVLMRAVDLGAAEPGQVFSELAFVGVMDAVPVSNNEMSVDQMHLATEFRANCIGIVAPGTDIAKLIMEVTAKKELAAGRLVRTQSGSQDVFYQLTNGLTQEEIVQQKNTFGFVAAHARNVGVWIEAEARFRPSSWVPSPNAPVALIEHANARFERRQIGAFPGTNFVVRLQNVDHLVTHNTAILGILGVGKSTLAMELVERVLDAGCKVIVLDLTDEYAGALADLLDPAYVVAVTQRLEAIGAPGKGNVQQNVEEGGSRQAFAQAVEGELDGFMGSNQHLLVLNPAAFEVWKQDSRQFQGTASTT